MCIGGLSQNVVEANAGTEVSFTVLMNIQQNVAKW